MTFSTVANKKNNILNLNDNLFILSQNDKDTGLCMNCLLIEMGEMVCYTDRLVKGRTIQRFHRYHHYYHNHYKPYINLYLTILIEKGFSRRMLY